MVTALPHYYFKFKIVCKLYVEDKNDVLLIYLFFQDIPFTITLNWNTRRYYAFNKIVHKKITIIKVYIAIIVPEENIF